MRRLISYFFLRASLTGFILFFHSFSFESAEVI